MEIFEREEFIRRETLRNQLLEANRSETSVPLRTILAQVHRKLTTKKIHLICKNCVGEMDTMLGRKDYDLRTRVL